MARDRGGPALAGQMLMCPMLDDRNDTPSARQMAGQGVWDHTSNHTGWTALLGDGVRRPRRLAVRSARPGRRPVGTAAHVHRRRLGRDVPRRGRDIRQPDLASGRRRRAARMAGRLPRLRDHGPASRPLTRSRSGPATVAAPSPGQLTPGPASRNPANGAARNARSSPGTGNRSRGEQNEQPVRVAHGRDRHRPARCRLDGAPWRPAETESGEPAQRGRHVDEE